MNDGNDLLDRLIIFWISFYHLVSARKLLLKISFYKPSKLKSTIVLEVLVSSDFLNMIAVSVINLLGSWSCKAV